MKMKTQKSVSKRVKPTKTGKLMKIKNGKGHFNSRESGKVTRNKRRGLAVTPVFARTMKSLLTTV